MKIKNVSCTQFAGVRDRNISFDESLNVVFGKNETGKSTLVNLISRILFQDSKLDRRRDKDFLDLYFPSKSRNATISGDFADGKITIESENGTYTLSKEWGSDARCTLSTPDGVVRDQSKINAILRDILVYGEGVYGDMLFSSQRDTDVSLQTILDASKKTDAKQEIYDVVSQAFAESDGISIDTIEQAINAKIDEIAGKHWDYDRETPVRKAGRWSTGLGEILKAYYALEDAKEVLEEISRLESDADRAIGDFEDKDVLVNAAEKEYEKFNFFSSRLSVQSEHRKTVVRIEKELSKIKEVLINWPELAVTLEEAKKLQAEKANRELLNKFESAKEIVDEINELNAKTDGFESPNGSEILQVENAQQNIMSLENKLCGVNLNLSLNMFNNKTAEITSLLTGKQVDIIDGVASITEAVKITVPDVLEMQLSPADIDAADVETQISKQKALIADIFAKYEINDLNALKDLRKTVSDTKAKIEFAKNRLSILLGTDVYEELEAAASEINCPVRSKSEIENDILKICHVRDLTGFIAAKSAVSDGYVSDYGSINDLKVKAFDLEAELKKVQESISVFDDIPAEYINISDPDAHLSALQNDLKFKQKLRENALTVKTSAISKVESYKENISGDPIDNFKKAETFFNEEKSLLKHWMHISEVFGKQKEILHNNPMKDIAESFTGYLSVVSDGKVSSEFPEIDKLNMNIYSNNRIIDYGKLSEGTKETVSLAFRLAVFDHLFPEGGGVIVFDDPFTNMDAERTDQACRLIKECSKRHQVIFLTCKEEYADMLGGNKICF